MEINTDDLYYAIEEAGSKASDLEYALSELDNAVSKFQNECWANDVDVAQYVNSDEADLKSVIKSAIANLSQFDLENNMWFAYVEEAQDEASS